MIGDRTRVAEVQVYAAIFCLGAALYLLTQAARSSAEGRAGYRKRIADLNLEGIGHHERVLELERQLQGRGDTPAPRPAPGVRRIVAGPTGPGEVQEPDDEPDPLNPDGPFGV